MIEKAPGAKCDECPLKDQPVVYGDGNPDADIIILGEGPGAEEVALGKPFVGKSGRLLNQVLNYYGIRREDVWTTNTVLCRPPANATPSAREVACCSGRLDRELAERNPVHILATGGVAAKAVTGSSDGITKIRVGGSRPAPRLPGVSVTSTFHPAFALRNPDAFPTIVNDIRKVARPATIKWEPTKYKEVFDVEQATTILGKQLDASRRLTLDVENDHTQDRGYDNPAWLCIGISHTPGTAVVYSEAVVNASRFQRALRAALSSKAHTWGYHNGQYDIKQLWSFAPEARVGFDTLLAHYCHAPGTRILKRDLTWTAVENLVMGEELVACEEAHTGVLTPGKVTVAPRRVTRPCYEVVTDYDKLVVSADHLWPCARAGWNKRVWRTTEYMAQTNQAQWSLARYVEPWEVDNTYEGGYIAGILDGEGSMQRGLRYETSAVYAPRISFAQKSGPVLNQTVDYLRSKGIAINLSKQRDSGVVVCTMVGPRAYLRALGMFRPTRFMQETDRWWVGLRRHTPVPIREINFVGMQEVVAVSTDTGTLIAEGYLSHNCTDERKGTHDLEQVSTETLNAPNYKTEAKKWLPRNGASLRNLPTNILHRYNATDTDVTHRLLQPLMEEMVSDGTVRPYSELLIPGTNALAAAEHAGVGVDIPYLQRLEDRYERSLADKEARIQSIAPINPRSPKQITEAFAARGSKLSDTTADTLRKLTGEPLAQAILDYRVDQKLLSTYIKGLSRRARGDRIFAGFRLYGTETGRLSSRAPNLQNIPRESGIRDAFVAKDGHVLLSVDYRAIEYRWLAVLSGDKNLLQAFRDNRNLHQEVAKNLFGPSYTKAEYVKAKGVNFGIAYEETAFHLGLRLGLSTHKAERMITEWYEPYPQVREYQTNVKQEVREKGYLSSYFGRKRRFWLITDDNWKHVKKEALNFKLQSPASDLTLQSLIRLTPMLGDVATPVITIHDALVFEVAKDHLSEVARTVKDVMEDTPIADVCPTPVELSVGRSWGSLEDYEIE